MLLFGIPADKDEVGSGAYDDEGVVQMAVRALKEAHPELIVITDVCLCEYTSHGHCGVVRDGEVDNDLTLELLAKTAISHAEAGADAVAPSDMMDGRVGAIRAPARRGGPLRDADHRLQRQVRLRLLRAVPRGGRARRPSSATAAATRWTRPTRARRVREAQLDLEEGADMVMVKPALPYLDVIRRVKEATERAGRRLPRLRRVLDAEGGRRERLDRRARRGARVADRRSAAPAPTSIITYYAKDAAAWLERD